MNERGWGWTASEIRRVQLLEWVAEQSAGHPELYVDVKDFYDARPDQSDNQVSVAWGDLTDLEKQGLIAEASGMGGIEAMSAMLTSKDRTSSKHWSPGAQTGGSVGPHAATS